MTTLFLVGKGTKYKPNDEVFCGKMQEKKIFANTIALVAVTGWRFAF